MRPFVKIALFVTAFIVLAAILAGVYLFNMKHTDLAKAKPDFVVTSDVLLKAFEENEDSASARYINKVLEVTGIVLSVTRADSNNLNISLKTGNDMSSVICTFTALKGPSEFKPGDEITIHGQCSGYLMDVLLNNCAIIRKRK